MFKVDKDIIEYKDEIEQVEAGYDSNKRLLIEKFSKSFYEYWKIIDKYGKNKRSDYIPFRKMKLTPEIGFTTLMGWHPVVRRFFYPIKNKRLTEILGLLALTSIPFIIPHFNNLFAIIVISLISFGGFFLSMFKISSLIIDRNNFLKRVISIDEFFDLYGVNGLYELNENAKIKAGILIPAKEEIENKKDIFDAEVEIYEFT